MKKIFVAAGAFAAAAILFAGCGGSSSTTVTTNSGAPASTAPSSSDSATQQALQNDFANKLQQRLNNSSQYQGDTVQSVDCSGPVNLGGSQNQTWSCHSVIATSAGTQDIYNTVTVYPDGTWISQ
jgi:hypothetical protein